MKKINVASKKVICTKTEEARNKANKPVQTKCSTTGYTKLINDLNAKRLK